MLILLSFNRKHHSSLILVLLLISLVFIIIVLSHEKAATTSLRTNISLVLSPIEVIRHCRSLVFSLPSCTFLNTESSITDSLVWGVDRLGSIISNSHSRACFHLENLLSHKPILLSKNINLVIVINHFLKLRIFFFEDQELLMEIMCAALSFEIQNVLQVLNLLLQLIDKCIILGADSVCAYFSHDLFGSIGKFKR